MRDLIMILSGIVGGTLFIVIRNYIIKRLKSQLVTGQAPISTEQFSLLKFIHGMTNVNNPVSWAKDIHDIFNLRKLIIVGVIISVITGYSYWKGQQSKPVQLIINEESEFTIPVPHSDLALYKAKNSTELQWINTITNKVVGKVKVKDIPELNKKLRPYGFQIKPFFTGGGSIGEKKTGFEMGLGVDVFKWYRSNLNAWLTNLGGYVGIGYQLTDNFDILVGIGKGFNGDNRTYLGGKFKF